LEWHACWIRAQHTDARRLLLYSSAHGALQSRNANGLQRRACTTIDTASRIASHTIATTCMQQNIDGEEIRRYKSSSDHETMYASSG